MAVGRRWHAELERGTIAPAWPTTHPSDVVLAYDPWPPDTLHVLLDGQPRPGYYVPVASSDRPTDGLSFKASMDRAELVDLMIEGYVVDGLSRSPAWVAIVPFSGIAPGTLAAFGLASLAGGLERDGVVSAFLVEAHAAWETTVRRSLLPARLARLDLDPVS